MARPTPAATDHRPPIAVSFLRLSDPKQTRGHGASRQGGDAERWCERNRITLDRTICHVGSALHGGQRRDTAVLGVFLDQVRAGAVPRGSFLIIENLDRLSREEERTALRLWLDILDAGVNIVQLHPETIFRCDRTEMADVIRAIIELSRGHSESQMKSKRTISNWAEAVDRARAGTDQNPRRKDGSVTKAITAQLPAWLELRKGVIAVVPARARIVRRIFELAGDGLGATTICKRLRAKKVKPLGRTDWEVSYVRLILRDRRAIGEYQPRNSAGEKLGDPITDYYPPVVSSQDYFAARAAVANGDAPKGRVGHNVANLFGGLLVDARGGKYVCTQTLGGSGKNKRLARVLRNMTSIQGRARATTFSQPVFEEAVLNTLNEISPREVLGAPAPGKADALRDELNWLRSKKAELAAELLKGQVGIVAEAARQLEAREAELRRKIDDAGVEETIPASKAFAQMKTLIAIASGSEDDRLKLRAAIRRVISEVVVLVVPRGRVRAAIVQVRFRASARTRVIEIVHVPAWSNASASTPERVLIKTLATHKGVANLTAPGWIAQLDHDLERIGKK